MHDTTPSCTTPSPENLDTTRTKTLAVLRQLAPDHSPQHLTTEQLSELMGVKPATIRRAHCMDGHYSGLIPVKLPNGRLRWKIA